MLEPRFGRWLDRASFFGLTAGAFVLGWVTGVQFIVLRLDLVVTVLVVGMTDAVLTAFGLTVAVVVSGGILLIQQLLRGGGEPPEPTDDVVTAIVPVYRDANVLQRSVESLLASTQPVEVVIVTEPDDPASQRRAEEFAESDRVRHLVNDRYPGTKAGAINYALEVTDGDHVGIFDADERIHPDFLATAVDKLDDCDVVPGRTIPQGTGPIETLVYCESILLDFAGQRLLYLLSGFRLAASHVLVGRREAVESVGGYDPAMVTEDFDFAYRCYKSHLDVAEQLRYPSTIESAHTLSDWWGQRKRWMIGYAQVFHRLLRDLVPPSGYRDVISVLVCGGTVIGSILLLSLIPKFLLLFVFGAGWVMLIPVVSVVGLVGLVRYIDLRRGSIQSLGLWWLLVPLILPLYGLAPAKALPEYLFSWDGEWYHAEKEA